MPQESRPSARQGQKLVGCLGILSLLIALIALAAWWPFFEPTLEIDAPSKADLNIGNPTVFSVKNTGKWTAYTIRCTAHVYKEIGGGFRITNGVNRVPRVANSLAPGDSTDTVIPLMRIYGAQLSEADIEIVLQFKRPYAVFHDYACARFKLGPDASQTLTWLRTPHSDCRDLWIKDDLSIQAARKSPSPQ